MSILSCFRPDNRIRNESQIFPKRVEIFVDHTITTKVGYYVTLGLWLDVESDRKIELHTRLVEDTYQAAIVQAVLFAAGLFGPETICTVVTVRSANEDLNPILEVDISEPLLELIVLWESKVEPENE